MLNPAMAQHFTNKTFDSGLVTYHEQISENLSGLDDFLGPGVCVLDFNKDGLFDVFHIQGSGIQRNLGRKMWWSNGKGIALFENVSSHNNKEDYPSFKPLAGVFQTISNYKGIGCSVADLNNSGLEDIIVSSQKALYIYENIGSRFIEHEILKTQKQALSTSILIHDFNNDGLLDIYLLNYIQYKKLSKKLEENKGVARISQLPNRLKFNSAKNTVYINQGNFEFKPVANNVSFEQGRSLSGLVTDLDGNKTLDVLVANDAGYQNQVYIKNRTNLISVTNSPALNIQTGTHQIIKSDLDNDGNFELIRLPIQGTGAPQVYTFRNNNYKNISWRFPFLGDLNYIQSPWGALSFDINNDGLEDIVTNNGFSSPAIGGDRIPQGQPNWMFINKMTPSDMLANYKAIRFPSPLGVNSGRGLARIDADNDGDSDLLIANNNGPLELWLNKEPISNNWIGFEVKQKHKAVSYLEVITKNTRRVIDRSHHLSFLSISDKRFLFRLKPQKSPSELSLKIHWNNGETTLFKNLNPGYYYLIDGKERIQKINYKSKIKKKKYTIDAFTRIQWELQLINYNPNYLNNIRSIFSELTHEQKYYLLNIIYKEITTDQLKIEYTTIYPILYTALTSQYADLQDISIKIIGYLGDEKSLVWLFNYINERPSTQQYCWATHVLGKNFFLEENITEREHVFITYLLKQLRMVTNEKLSCLIETLKESKDYRIVYALLDQFIKMTTSNRKKSLDAITQIGELNLTNYIQRIIPSTTELKLALSFINNNKPSATKKNTASKYKDNDVFSCEKNNIRSYRKKSYEGLSKLLCNNKHLSLDVLIKNIGSIDMADWDTFMQFKAKSYSLSFYRKLFRYVFENNLNDITFRKFYLLLINNNDHMAMLSYQRAITNNNQLYKVTALKYAYKLSLSSSQKKNIKKYAFDKKKPKKIKNAALNSLIYFNDKKAIEFYMKNKI